MAQYEQKTDSKEFEWAPGTGANPADAANISLRLWMKDPKGSLTWKTDSVLVYMIADLVAASRGCIVDDEAEIMTAQFSSPGHALVAAKRIETAVEEFLRCRPSDYLGASILIHAPACSAFGGRTDEGVQGAMQLVQPGQILLSAETCDRLRSLPGIELRSIAPLTTGGQEGPVWSELIWAPAWGGNNRESRVSENVTESLPAGATVMMSVPPAITYHEDVESWQNAEGSHFQQKDVTGTNGDLDGGADQSLTEELEAERPFLTRASVLVGLGAIVALAALAVAFYPSRTPKVPVRVQQNEPSGSVTPSAHTTPIQAQQEKGFDQNDATPGALVEKAAQKAEVTTKPPVVKHFKKEPAVGEQEPQGAEFDGMSQRDIPRLLTWARADAGNGNYEKARREYRAVLKMQPTNQEAREGLHKLDLAESSEQ